MAQQTITEKEQFITTWDREFQTTLKLLRNFPDGKETFKPADKSRTARELAWIFVMEEGVAEAASKGTLEAKMPPPPPAVPVSEITKIYEDSHRENLGRLKAMSDEAFGRMTKFPVGPGQMGDMPTSQVFWIMLMDAVHHRGQLSVYLRMVGAKVPSIYGPSLDEPWF